MIIAHNSKNSSVCGLDDSPASSRLLVADPTAMSASLGDVGNDMKSSKYWLSAVA